MVSMQQLFALVVAVNIGCAGRPEHSTLGRDELLRQQATAPADAKVALALARFDAAHGREQSAIAGYLRVEQASGLFGSALTAQDRSWLAKALRDRAMRRISHGMLSARRDADIAAKLDRNSRLPTDAVVQLRTLETFARMRAADDRTRNQGVAQACQLAGEGVASFAGACPGASAELRQTFAAVLWSSGAKRSAVEVLESAEWQLEVPFANAAAWWWYGTLSPTRSGKAPAGCSRLSAAYATVDSPQSPASFGAMDVRERLAADGHDVSHCSEQSNVALLDAASLPTLAETQASVINAIARRWQLPVAKLTPLAEALQNTPEAFHRVATDLAEASSDDAIAYAAAAEYLRVFGSAAQSRGYWQRAVDLANEPTFITNLAIACAEANDPDAALVWATAAAAASGDPAWVLFEVGEALAAVGNHSEALSALKQAHSLAGGELVFRIEFEIDRSLMLLKRSPVFASDRRGGGDVTNLLALYAQFAAGQTLPELLPNNLELALRSGRLPVAAIAPLATTEPFSHDAASARLSRIALRALSNRGDQSSSK